MAGLPNILEKNLDNFYWLCWQFCPQFPFKKLINLLSFGWTTQLELCRNSKILTEFKMVFVS
jgi:hypothetical protein